MGLEVCCRRFLDQRFLKAVRGGYPHGNVSIVMMIIRKHCEDPVANKEGRFTMRKFLDDVRQRHADFPHALQMFLSPIGF